MTTSIILTKAIDSNPSKMLSIAEFVKATDYDINPLYIDTFWLSLTEQPDNEHIIHLNKSIINMIGYSGNDKQQKRFVVRLLKTFAKIDIDYKISAGVNKDPGNTQYKSIDYCLTPTCFKKLLLKANTQYSDKVYEYYIALEKLIIIYTKYQASIQLKLQQNEHQKQLQTYQQQLQLAERISSLPPQQKINTTSSIIYIAANEPMANKNIYKIGHISTNSRKALSNRLISYATGYDQPLQYIAIYPVYQAKHIDTILSRLLIRFKHTDNQQKELVTTPLDLLKRYIEQYLSNLDSLITSINDLSIDDYVEQMKQTPEYKPLSIQEAYKLANNEKEPIQSTMPKPKQSLPAFYKDNKIDIDMLVNEVISQIKKSPVTWRQVKKMTNDRLDPIKTPNKRNSNDYINWITYQNIIKLKAKDKQIIITINSK